jgi:glycosyltransferase involved in cell wall biosynthesis
MARFSVLVATYNQSNYLRQTIDSLLSQTFTDFEVYVVDDGSTDDTPKVLEAYRGRINVLRQLNQGPEVARNHAAASARGEYLVMFDGDDVLLPSALAVYDQVIRAFSSPPLVIGSMVRFKTGQPIPAKAFVPHPVEVLQSRDFLARDIGIHLSNSRIVMRRDVFSAVGGYGSPHTTSFNTDDFNLILKTGNQGPCFFIQKPFTVAKRDHESNISRNLTTTANAMLGLAYSEYAGLYPGGKERRLDRYANIGGASSAYAVRYCWRGGERKLALKVLTVSAPMVFAAVRKKLLRPFRPLTKPIILPVQGDRPLS